jgi:hypothetical protein
VEGRRKSPAVDATYRSRLAARRAEGDRLERLHRRLSSARLALFLAGLGIAFVVGRTSLPWLLIPLLAFVALLFVHARVLNARDRALRAAAFYERGLARVEDRWQGGGERGERFRDPSHLYAEDLELFGAGGLFENLFNIARMPDEAFQRGLFKAVFTFVVPMLLVSNVPARLLLDKLRSPLPLALLLGMSVMCFVVSEVGWRASVRRYTSASS